MMEKWARQHYFLQRWHIYMDGARIQSWRKDPADSSDLGQLFKLLLCHWTEEWKNLDNGKRFLSGPWLKLSSKSSIWWVWSVSPEACLCCILWLHSSLGSEHWGAVCSVHTLMPYAENKHCKTSHDQDAKPLTVMNGSVFTTHTKVSAFLETMAWVQVDKAFNIFPPALLGTVSYKFKYLGSVRMLGSLKISAWFAISSYTENH